MPLRLLEVYHDGRKDDIENAVEKIPIIDIRHEKLSSKEYLTKIIIQQKKWRRLSINSKNILQNLRVLE